MPRRTGGRHGDGGPRCSSAVRMVGKERPAADVAAATRGRTRTFCVLHSRDRTAGAGPRLRPSSDQLVEMLMPLAVGTVARITASGTLIAAPRRPQFAFRV